jgi:hypothetical protein
MGTNYYVAKKSCEHCNRWDEEYHIGKDSYGWAFIFQGYPAERLTSWKAWKEFLREQEIRDEYGEKVNYHWFVNHIETAKNPQYMYPNERQNLQHNTEGRAKGWFDSKYDWDDADGYAFSTREFS